MSKIPHNKSNFLEFLNSPDKTLNIATLCSGIGTPEIAFNELNIKTNIIFACEIDKFPRKTYMHNHNILEKYFFTDIAAFNAKEYLGLIDILIFGSPCQPFSIRGYRKGFNDPRGKVFFDGIERIDECKPEIVVFENVKGLLSQENGEAFNIVKEEFIKIGYTIKYKVFNSYEHGSNQGRERIFIVAFRDEDLAEAFKIDDFEIISSDLIIEDYLLPIEDVDEKYWLSATARKMMDQEVQDAKRIERGVYLKERWEHCNVNKSNNHKAYTITASYAKGHPNNVLVDQRGCKYDFWTCDFAFSDMCDSCDMDEGCCNYQFTNVSTPACRRLTPRECARIQNIPDSFEFPVSDSRAYQQIGNSIDIKPMKDILFKICNLSINSKAA